MINMLKVKIASLVAESRIIRASELKCKGDNWSHIADQLRFHRVMDVRKELRSAGLAYGYLKGHAYETLEGKVKEKHEGGSGSPDWDCVDRIVKKFGGSSKHQEFKNWNAEIQKKAA